MALFIESSHIVSADISADIRRCYFAASDSVVARISDSLAGLTSMMTIIRMTIGTIGYKPVGSKH